MNLAIVGSRNFEAYEYMCLEIESTIDITQVTSIISGGAAGADSMAEKFAQEKEIKIVIFPADWNKFGKSAGYVRNEDIIQSSDVVLAFWDGESKGTKHSISLAKKYKKELHVYKYFNVADNAIEKDLW